MANGPTTDTFKTGFGPLLDLRFHEVAQKHSTNTLQRHPGVVQCDVNDSDRRVKVAAPKGFVLGNAAQSNRSKEDAIAGRRAVWKIKAGGCPLRRRRRQKHWASSSGGSTAKPLPHGQYARVGPRTDSLPFTHACSTEHVGRSGPEDSTLSALLSHCLERFV